MRIIVWRILGLRKQSHYLLLLLVLVLCGKSLTELLWSYSEQTSSALLPPKSLDHQLDHYRRNRQLKDYLDNIQLLIQPSSTACEGAEEVPLVVMVSSAPNNLDQRAAIRSTWAKHQPTFFLLGLDGPEDNQLADTYIEAKEFSDMVVFDLQESYTNLTLKTALMLHWVRRRCPHAGAVFKTDDDVFVNPWAMRDLVMTNRDKQLIGYKLNNSVVHRDQYTKWFLPRWLYPDDCIPEYLSGTGYIINGDYVDPILKAAQNVPLINLEDVYFTQMVAKTTLGLELSHNSKLSPFRPWVSSGCAYWVQASSHSLSPDDIEDAWSKLTRIAIQYEKGHHVCNFWSFLASYWLLY